MLFTAKSSPRNPKGRPRSRQDGPRDAGSKPKSRQERPREAPRAPKSGLKAAPERPRTTQERPRPVTSRHDRKPKPRYTVQQTNKKSFRTNEGRSHFTRCQLASRAFNARVHSSTQRNPCAHPEAPILQDGVVIIVRVAGSRDRRLRALQPNPWRQLATQARTS